MNLDLRTSKIIQKLFRLPKPFKYFVETKNKKGFKHQEYTFNLFTVRRLIKRGHILISVKKELIANLDYIGRASMYGLPPDISEKLGSHTPIRVIDINYFGIIVKLSEGDFWGSYYEKELSWQKLKELYKQDLTNEH